MMSNDRHLGSRLTDFLDEDGILEEVDARVHKRVIADQLREAMKQGAISEAALARSMSTSRSVVRSLLDPTSPSATLVSLVRAAHAVGRELEISLVPRVAPRRARPKTKRAVLTKRAAR